MRVQQPGDPAGGVGELGPRDLVGVVDHRHLRTELDHVALEQARHHRVGVEARGPVARDELLGERRGGVLQRHVADATSAR